MQKCYIIYCFANLCYCHKPAEIIDGNIKGICFIFLCFGFQGNICGNILFEICMIEISMHVFFHKYNTLRNICNVLIK